MVEGLAHDREREGSVLSVPTEEERGSSETLLIIRCWQMLAHAGRRESGAGSVHARRGQRSCAGACRKGEGGDKCYGFSLFLLCCRL